MKKILITLTFLFLSVACSEPKSYDFNNGDIIFQDSPSSQSQAIKLATHSDYSHVGIIYKKDKKLYVYEAVGPVVLTPLENWIEHGVGEKYVVKRLKDTSPLTAEGLKAMQKVAHTFAQKPYDGLFGWSDERIYCSELVWKIYKRALGIELGKLKRLRDFDLTSPVVKAKLQERYGNEIPYNEKVIDPQGVFDSELLITVHLEM